MVLACGVRKVWTKEFQNHIKPSQQIKRLKEILTDLGMTGRFTLQQAKLIKENRELAQELGKLGQYHFELDRCDDSFRMAEDVRSFQKMVTSIGTGKKANLPSESSDDEAPDEAPVKRKVRMITAPRLHCLLLTGSV